MKFNKILFLFMAIAAKAHDIKNNNDKLLNRILYPDLAYGGMLTLGLNKYRSKTIKVYAAYKTLFPNRIKLDNLARASVSLKAGFGLLRGSLSGFTTGLLIDLNLDLIRKKWLKK